MNTKLIRMEIFDKYIENKLLSKSELGNLVLFNYTDHCTFSRSWDEITLNSRGTIYNKDTGDCVALSFSKFFNLNESEWTQVSSLPLHLPFQAFEKMDGSIGLLFKHEGKYRVSTRGSFHSEQAKKATEMLSKYKLDHLSDELSLVFEIIYPDNRIVIDYGEKEELVLLACFNNKTGVELSWPEVEEIAIKSGFNLPKVYMHTLEELVELAKTINFQEEGWVIRFENGLRVKIKGADYLRIAKIKSHLSPLSLYEAMETGDADRYRESIPEELKDQVEEIYGILSSQLNQIVGEVEQVATRLGIDKIDLKNKEECKLIALKIKAEPSWMQAGLFSIMRGLSTHITLLRLIKPVGNVYVDVVRLLNKEKLDGFK